METIKDLFSTNPKNPKNSKNSKKESQQKIRPEISPYPLNARNEMNGLDLLESVSEGKIHTAFFDPQYRGVLDQLSYGNEGGPRGSRRSALQQMPEKTIRKFLKEISRVLVPSGHLFLWLDKFHLCSENESWQHWIQDVDLETVDLLTWDKRSFGMGYRTRRRSEYLLVLQKPPRKARGVWNDHKITDVWSEKVSIQVHPHTKPMQLQTRLIAAVTPPGGIVLDPAAGSFSVCAACWKAGRDFLGSDLKG